MQGIYKINKKQVQHKQKKAGLYVICIKLQKSWPSQDECWKLACIQKCLFKFLEQKSIRGY